MSSNLKKTRYRESVSRRGRERLRKANRRFDLCAAALALLILIAMAICFRQEYELGSNQPSGFAMWFLLFLAYLPLELVTRRRRKLNIYYDLWRAALESTGQGMLAGMLPQQETHG